MNQQRIADLIAQLKAASEGSQGLNIEISLLVLPQRSSELALRDYTRSLDAALTLVPEGRAWVVRDLKPGCYAAIFTGQDRGVAKAATVPLALCIAALRVRLA
jgi:hypothetical protein